MTVSARVGEGSDTRAARTRRLFALGPFVGALWTGLAVSLLGDAFYRVALTWNVSTTGGGALHEGLLGAAMAIPTAAMGMFGGVIADHYSRPAAMIITDIVRAVIVGGLSVTFLAGQPSLAVVLVGAALLSGSGICFGPAFQAWLPDLFDDRDTLVSFDVLYISTISAMGVIGPAIAGWTYPAAGPSGLLVIDAISFVVSAAAVLYVQRHRSRTVVPVTPPRAAGKPARAPLLRGIRDGLSYIFGTPELRVQFAVFPVMECAGYALVFILPTYLVAEGRAESWLFGTMLAASAAGRLLGAWLLRHSPLRHHRGRVLSVNHIVQGAALLLFCIAPTPLVSVVSFVLMGLPAGASQIALSSWVQTNVSRELRGRAFGTLTSFVQWLMPLGPVLFGAVAAWFSPAVAVAAMAMTFCAGGAVICSSRAVRSMK